MPETKHLRHSNVSADKTKRLIKIATYLRSVVEAGGGAIRHPDSRILSGIWPRQIQIAASYTLTDLRHQVLQLTFIPGLDALKSEWSVVAIPIDTIQEQDMDIRVSRVC